MNTQKIQTTELETVLKNVLPNRRKVLAAMVLAASAGLPCVAAPASTPAAAHIAANNLASFEGAQVLTWIVDEVSLLTGKVQTPAQQGTKVSSGTIHTQPDDILKLKPW